MRYGGTIRTGLAALGLTLAAPALAEACPMPPTPNGCGQSGAADTLAARERLVEQLSARPATWAARARQFRAWLATATDAEGKPLDDAARTGHVTDQIQTLDKEIARARGLTATASQAAILGDKCLARWLAMGCRVPLAGVLRDGDGTRILWQLQSGASEEDGGGMGVMLWDAAATPRLIGWTFEGVWMEAPRYGAANKLLWVTGRMAGTGDGNADLLLQRQDARWVSIDLESWREDFERRLPKGYGAWHGVDYDLTSLSATTELWKEGDANCCATGGRANLEFEVVGSTLRLKGISAQLGGPDKEWKDY